MKKVVLLTAVVLAFAAAPGSVEAQSRLGGCLKYGLGGAVAGHLAGGHRLKGALAGCALGIYQRRKYERESRERSENRNRIPERRRAPTPEPDSRYDDRDRRANRIPLPRQEKTSPYEDLGLDPGRRTTREQATRGEDRIRNSGRGHDGHTSGGSFARGQQDSRNRFENQEKAPDPRRLRRSDPEETGSFPPMSGKFY